MTDVTDEQLDEFQKIWNNHGFIIRDIIYNYKEGRADKPTTMALLRPYTMAIETMHAIAKEVMDKFAEVHKE